MSLPEKLSKQILHRFDELIAEGEAIRKASVHVPEQIEFSQQPFLSLPPTRIVSRAHNTVDIEQVIEWQTRLISLIDHTIPKSSAHSNLLTQLTKAFPDYNTLTTFLPKLKAIRKDFESHLFDNLNQRIEAAVASDYMGLAKELLGDKHIHLGDYVPAAVLAGAVLEKHLRELCTRQQPPIEILKASGESLTINPLIISLGKAQVFEKPLIAQLTAWASIRNSAAHGKFDEFNSQEVKAMLDGVQRFLVDYS